MEYLELNNGVKMPVEGLGTFLMSPADAEAASLAALTPSAGVARRSAMSRWTSCQSEASSAISAVTVGASSPASWGM